MNLVLLPDAGDLQSLDWRYLGTSLMQTRYTNSEFPSRSFPPELIKTIVVVVVVVVVVQVSHSATHQVQWCCTHY